MEINRWVFDLPIGSESYPWIFLKNQVKTSVYVYVRLVNLKGHICLFGGSKKRTKFWFENLLGQISIMVINQFVFVWFVLLLFLFCSENAVSQNRVWSDVWPPRQNSTYLLCVLISTLANLTTPGCEQGTEQKHHKKDPTQPWFWQDDCWRRFFSRQGFFPHSFLIYY